MMNLCVLYLENFKNLNVRNVVQLTFLIHLNTILTDRVIINLYILMISGVIYSHGGKGEVCLKIRKILNFIIPNH